MVDTKNKLKQDLTQAARGVSRGTIGMTVALGTMVATGNPLIGLGTGYLYLKNDTKLLNAFKFGLQHWRQEKGQSLTMRAKLLRFRNALSYGFATAQIKDKKYKHDLKMKYFPQYRKAYEKAQKEGRKFGLKDKLKAYLEDFANAAVSQSKANMIVNPEIINHLYGNRRGRP